MSAASFRPAWWLPGPHLQTMGARLLRGRERVPLQVDRIELPDGDFVDLQEDPIDLPEAAPIALVLHGLEGSARANYVASLARELRSAGIRAVRLNFRACSGEMNRLPRFYHAGDTSDLDFVVRYLRRKQPESPIAAVGFSLGGNVLLKYLGERGESASNDLIAAVAVSVPFDLAAGTKRLESPGMGRVYSFYFLRKLKSKARGKQTALAGICEIDRALTARTVREYDEALTARLHGFRDAWHYYESSSSISWLDRIRIPTALIHAMDDPFLPRDRVPLEALRRNPYLVDRIANFGGHVGFVTGAPWRPVFWAEREAARFIRTRLAGRNSVTATTHSP